MPKCHFPNETVHIGRRCDQGYFYLRPDTKMVKIFQVVFAFYAAVFGLKVHAAVQMSNHYHAIVTDPEAIRSAFFAAFHRYLAWVVKRRHRIQGHFWDEKLAIDISLVDRKAIEDSLVYVWTNPVRAGIVPRVRQYTGFMVRPEDWGTVMTFERPDGILKSMGFKTIEFRPMPPPGYEDQPLHETQKHFLRLIAEGENKIHTFRRRHQIQGWITMSIARRMKHNHKIESETLGPQRRVHFMATTDETRRWAKARRKSFLVRYHKAMQRLREGAPPDFPEGTVRYRLLGLNVVPWKHQYDRDPPEGVTV